MTRDDLRTFRALDIDFDSIGMLQDNADDFAYFCTPVGAEYVGRIGCDGVHFVLLPGDERVFCVDPSMGEIGTYVLPVGSDFREFLSFLLYCRDANPLSQIYFLTEERFRTFAADEAEARESGDLEELFKAKDAALAKIAEVFDIAPVEPYEKVKALQAAFDPSGLHFSDEYYDVLGLENPRHPGEERIQGTSTAVLTGVILTGGGISMLPQDPNILLSYVNTKLRDEYGSLDALCEGLDVAPEELELPGYAYDPDINQFKPV